MTGANNFWFEVVGLIAACLTTSSFFPQAIRIWRARSAGDVSLTMYVMMTVGMALWLAYGLHIGSIAMIAANSASLVMTGSVLALKVQDMLRPKNLLVEIVAHEAATGPIAVPVNSNEDPEQPPAAA